MENKKYYKIRNVNECVGGIKCIDGITVIDEFDESPDHQNGGQGIHFTDAENVFGFVEYGNELKEVILPVDDPNFKMVIAKENRFIYNRPKQYRANKIILGKKQYDLYNLETIKMLEKEGADIHNNQLLAYCAYNNYLDSVKYIIEKKSDVYALDDIILTITARNGYLDVVKYLIELGVYTDAAKKEALRISRCADVIKYLISIGVDVHTDNDYALRICARYGHLDVVKYLVEEKGANIHAKNDWALKFSERFGHLDVVEYLIEKGANIDVIKDLPRMVHNKIIR